MNDLTNSREFVEGIVDKIVNETNLSEVIMKIEPIVKENQELRSLIHSQQQMMNEMNMTLFRLLNEYEQYKTYFANVEKAARTEQPIHKEEKQELYEEVSTMTFNDNGLNSDGLYSSEITEIVLSQHSLDEHTTEPDQQSEELSNQLADRSDDTHQEEVEQEEEE